MPSLVRTSASPLHLPDQSALRAGVPWFFRVAQQEATGPLPPRLAQVALVYLTLRFFELSVHRVI